MLRFHGMIFQDKNFIYENEVLNEMGCQVIKELMKIVSGYISFPATGFVLLILAERHQTLGIVGETIDPEDEVCGWRKLYSKLL